MSWEGIAYPPENAEIFPTDRLLGLDFETKSTTDLEVDLMAVSWETAGGVESVVYECKKLSSRQKDFLFARLYRAKAIVAHNTLFEMKVLWTWGFDVDRMRGRLHDSMAIIGVYDTEAIKGLKENAHLVGMTLNTYEQAVKATRPEFIEYCREDAICCLKLYRHLRPWLTEFNLWEAYRLELDVAFVALHIYANGCFVDRAKYDELGAQAKRMVGGYQVRLCQLAGRDINFNSTKQLRGLLYEDFGLEPNPDFFTKGGKTGNRQPGTDVDALKDLLTYDELPDEAKKFIRKLLRYRSWSKYSTTYLSESFSSWIWPDGKIHANLKPFGTRTSRFSSADPNMQNLSARGISAPFRSIWVASPGNRLLQVDYSQIEYRFLAHYMRDRRVIEGFLQGRDYHAITAELFGVDRKLGKKLNFTLVYLAGVKKLAQELGIPRQMAQDYYDLYHKGLPNLRKLAKAILGYAKLTGYVEMMSGRRRSISHVLTGQGGQSPESVVLNTLIQGNSGELIKLVMVRIDKMLPREVGMILQIHDELLFDGPEKILTEIQPEIKDVMENTITLDVPIIADPKIVDNWKQAK